MTNLLAAFVIVLHISLLFIQPAFAEANSVVEPDQSVAIAKIVEISKQLQPPKLRGQHPKGHGTVWAEFTVAPDLPESLRVGLFKEPGKTYPAWIRFSNARGSDDTQPGLHGMAIKLMNIAGDKVLETEKTAQTQDFLMVDHPVFFIRNASDFAAFFAAVATGKQAAFFATHPQAAKITQSFQKKQIQNLLATQYWSTTPYRFGETAIKFSARPTSQIAGAVGTTPDYLRAAMADALMAQDATFDFLIQLQTDPDKMPIEDPTVEWLEQDTPLQKVATIRIPRQVFDTPEQFAFGEGLSFTPWHSLPEHQPLGSINRARKAVYQATAEQRHQDMEMITKEPSPDSFTPRLLDP
ncbi:catalase family protein [Leptolyngbya sp. 7M]|uniref:catalase family protein n=1 Tax=Leptolyngbya sp. 7M TaxID=2812896 RepID=UPI001B8A9FDB|nr:catalase family protein [Leptolyngbya sp. 7M]QYO67577.1 catalase family protein [Leptolyngbya sp. 7M]